MSEAKKVEKKTETVEDELVLGDSELKEISKKVGEDIAPAITDAVEKASKASAKEITEDVMKRVEEIKQKNVKAGEGDEDEQSGFIAKALKAGKTTEEITKMSRAQRIAAHYNALANENQEVVKQFNAYNLADQLEARAKAEKKGGKAIEKAGYANETTAADGGVLIPDAEFVTTVFENLPNYGVAFKYADVRQTDRTSVRVINLTSGLTFYATAEAGVKTGAKLALSKQETSLSKYAVIVPATDELTDDAAIDFWNLVTKELTRAYARKADEVVFTDATSGITNLSGVLTENVSGAGTTISWSDLLDSEAKLEDDIDTSNFKWFMRKETWYRLVQTRGTTNDHYLAGSLNTATGWVGNINQPTTPWGTPVVFTRVLPTSNAVNANDAFAVYGDLSNYLLYNKRGMDVKVFDAGVVKDADASDFNLITQDGKAMRAVIRLLGVCPTGNRSKFVVLGTGTVS